MKVKVKYPTTIKQRRLGEKLYVLETIRDLDEAIDIICVPMSEQEKLDPFAEDLCPYFGVLWPAAEALAVYLHENPGIIKGKRVLEIGCGPGLPSLVAENAGAKVLATDFHPDAEEYFLRNCRHSNLQCDYRRLNWREERNDLGKFDVVMGSDVLYESRHPREIVKGLKRFLKTGGTILLSDPGRGYLQQFLNAMEEEGNKHEMSSIGVDGQEVFLFLFTEC